MGGQPDILVEVVAGSGALPHAHDHVHAEPDPCDGGDGVGELAKAGHNDAVLGRVLVVGEGEGQGHNEVQLDDQVENQVEVLPSHHLFSS